MTELKQGVAAITVDGKLKWPHGNHRRARPSAGREYCKQTQFGGRIAQSQWSARRTNPWRRPPVRDCASIARVGDHLYAFDDLCTCADEACPLSGGLLQRNTIMCQCHGSRFDITTGSVINGPATQALNVYEIKEVDGSIQIRA